MQDQRRQAEQRLAEQAAEEEQQRVLDLQRQEEVSDNHHSHKLCSLRFGSTNGAIVRAF